MAGGSGPPVDNSDASCDRVATVVHVSRRLAGLTIAAVCALALLTGCTPQPAEAPTPTPRFTNEAQAFKAAEETYRAYVDAVNALDTLDPATFESAYDWTTGEALAADKKNLTRYYSKGISKTGAIVIELIAPRDVNADGSSVSLDVCENVSGVDLIDKSGVSIVAADRPDVQQNVVTLKASNSSQTGFLVESEWKRTDGPSCSPG
jgi:hypothetical protein